MNVDFPIDIDNNMILYIVIFMVSIGLIIIFNHRNSIKRPDGPTPSWHPLGVLPIMLSNPGKIFHIVYQWSNIYGGIFVFRVVNSYIYVCSDYNLINEVYTNSRQFQTRGKNGIKYFIPMSLLGVEHCDQQWKDHRKILNGAFTDQYLKQYSIEILQVGREMVNVLLKNGHIEDINEYMFTIAYNILCNTVLGSSWAKLLPSVGTKVQLKAALTTASRLTSFPEVLWKYIPFEAKTISTTHCHEVRATGLKHIEEVRENNTQGSSMMHFLIHHPSKLCDDEIIDELMSMTMAGHESE